MKEIPLTQGKVAIVDDEDFEVLNKYLWCAYKIHGIWYAHRFCSVSMHREIMNAPKGIQVDHINGNGLDNRRSNLRLCSSRQNQMNKKIRTDNTSGYKGVCKNSSSGKWEARIGVNGKGKYLGLFLNKEDAARAYDRAAKEIYGEFANTNFGE